MLTVEEALEGILSRVEPLGVERVEIMGALGRVLAEPIVSRATIPPWANSSMDGYAVRASDTDAKPVELAVVGRIIAGAMPSRALGRGESMRIFTGAPRPAPTCVRQGRTSAPVTWSSSPAVLSARQRWDCWRRSATHRCACIAGL